MPREILVGALELPNLPSVSKLFTYQVAENARFKNIDAVYIVTLQLKIELLVG
jgi:hypothetical protein